MRVIDVLQNDKKPSKWIVDNYKKGLLYVDNSFQRRYVWLEKHQIQLIETILLGYAIPEIYLWETETDPETGNIKYSIVDGQQRIGALFDYIDGKFKLKSNFITNKNSTYANKFFSELSDEEKKNIWNYKFSIRQIPEEVEQSEIIRMFLRLNSTDKSLNPQELRNAEFDGEFLATADVISKFDFWSKNKVFSTNSLRRMSDIEFVSSLLIFLRKGIESEISQTVINEMYDLFNETYLEKEEDIKLTKQILDEIQRIIDNNKINAKFIAKTTHLYTVFTLTYLVISQGNNYSKSELDKITDFIDKYTNQIQDKLVDEYKGYSQDSTKSKQSRMNRLRILREYVGI